MAEDTRASARISLARLGEYLCAPTAAKRRAIVKDQKEPNDFKRRYYSEARTAVARLLLKHPAHAMEIEKAATLVKSRITSMTKPPEKTRLLNNVAVVRAWSDVDLAPFVDAEVQLGKRYGAKVSVGGVAVSVEPEVVILRDQGFEKASAGAVLLYLSKTAPLTPAAGETVAALLHVFVEENLSALGMPKRAECVVVDVFHGGTFAAPRAIVRRRKELAATCAEIAGTWDAI